MYLKGVDHFHFLKFFQRESVAQIVMKISRVDCVRLNRVCLGFLKKTFSPVTVNDNSGLCKVSWGS